MTDRPPVSWSLGPWDFVTVLAHLAKPSFESLETALSFKKGTFSVDGSTVMVAPGVEFLAENQTYRGMQPE